MTKRRRAVSSASVMATHLADWHVFIIKFRFARVSLQNEGGAMGIRFELVADRLGRFRGWSRPDWYFSQSWAGMENV